MSSVTAFKHSPLLKITFYLSLALTVKCLLTGPSQQCRKNKYRNSRKNRLKKPNNTGINTDDRSPQVTVFTLRPLSEADIQPVTAPPPVQLSQPNY
jgi:hypothetical protein